MDDYKKVTTSTRIIFDYNRFQSRTQLQQNINNYYHNGLQLKRMERITIALYYHGNGLQLQLLVLL
jgi:hypothetical protein